MLWLFLNRPSKNLGKTRVFELFDSVLQNRHSAVQICPSPPEGKSRQAAFFFCVFSRILTGFPPGRVIFPLCLSCPKFVPKRPDSTEIAPSRSDRCSPVSYPFLAPKPGSGTGVAVNPTDRHSSAFRSDLNVQPPFFRSGR